MSDDILNGEWVIPFGKHRFSRLRDVPLNYLLGIKGNRTYSVIYADLMQFIEANISLIRAGVSPFPAVKEVLAICYKYQYASEDEAKKHLREIRNKGQNSTRHKLPIRAYQCDICPFWHLTSRPERFFSK